MFGRKQKEREFTCNRCGARWYASVKIPRKPGKMEMAGANLQANGSRMSLFGKSSAAELHYANLQNQQARAQVYGACPNCGSKSATSKVVKL